MCLASRGPAPSANVYITVRHAAPRPGAVLYSILVDQEEREPERRRRKMRSEVQRWKDGVVSLTHITSRVWPCYAPKRCAHLYF